MVTLLFLMLRPLGYLLDGLLLQAVAVAVHIKPLVSKMVCLAVLVVVETTPLGLVVLDHRGKEMLAGLEFLVVLSIVALAVVALEQLAAQN